MNKKCDINWCIALAAEGQTKCSVHLEHPDYKPAEEPSRWDEKPNYVYIVCETVDGMPSFRHVFVTATDDDEAYEAGHEAMPDWGSNGLFNDYVARLPE